MSCSPASEAVMSLHKAWRAGGGRPEGWDQNNVSIIQTQGMFVYLKSYEMLQNTGQNWLHSVWKT